MTYPDKDLFIESGNSFQCLHKKKNCKQCITIRYYLKFSRLLKIGKIAIKQSTQQKSEHICNTCDLELSITKVHVRNFSTLFELSIVLCNRNLT